MDIAAAREQPREQERINNLRDLIPQKGFSALDVGARDGHLSRMLTSYFEQVTALDLEKPTIKHERILPLKGNATNLDFSDNSFDLVLCSEVLEHIPSSSLELVCSEISRVAKNHVLIGVPYQQDIRKGCTTCYTCGGTNPPYAHVNTFNEAFLRKLFSSLLVEKTALVGEVHSRTNSCSTWLMDMAGNPYGTYRQEEHCIHCDSKLKTPPPQSLIQKVYTKIAFCLDALQDQVSHAHPNWVHILFKKPN